MKAAFPFLMLVLAGCASDPARDDLAGLPPAHSPECQLSAANRDTPPGHVASAERKRCGKDQGLQWSPGRRDTIKPDFGGKRDD